MPATATLMRIVGPLCLVAVLAQGQGRPYEAYMVTAAETEIYKGNQRTDFRLRRGDVVSARPVELYNDWLNIMLNENVYQGRADHFGRLRDLRVEYAGKTAEFQAQIDEIDQDIASLIPRIEQLHAAEKAISFDSMVRYRYRRIVPATPDASSQAIPGQSPVSPSMRVVYTYEDKISPSAARNQARRWEREREDLEDELDALQEKRRELLLRLNRADAQLAYVEWRFQAFRFGEGILRGQPYVSVKDRVSLFVQQALALELDRDVVVVASLNRTNPRWLRIRYQGTLYDARKESFMNLLEVESTLGRQVARLQDQIQETEEDNALLRSRRDLLQSIMLAADYRSRLTYVSLSVHPFSGGYAGSRFYSPPAPPVDAREFILRRRARSFIRDWEKEREAIDSRIRRNRNRLLDWKRELAGFQPKLRDLRARLSRQR